MAIFRLAGDYAKNRRKFSKLCMQGLGLISYRSMGLAGLTVTILNFVYGFWNKIQEGYYVVRAPKVFVKKKSRMNSKFFSENAFLGKF